MESKHRDLLRKHRMALCSGFSDKSEEILGALVNSKIFTVVDREIIFSQQNVLKRSEKILDLLPKRGPKAFESFVRILTDNSFEDLVQLLSGNLENVPSDEKDGDSLDGRPTKVDEAPLAVPDALSPVDKHARLDDTGDAIDTPPLPKVSDKEDGPFSFKKKEKMEIDYPIHHSDQLNPDDCYPMKYLPRGKFLLINNKDFLPESGMAPYTRNGTDVDAASMKALFEELGFIVEEHRNITCYEIRKAFKRAAVADYSKMSAFAACVLSHGQEGILYGIDGTIDIKELTGFFRGNNLAGKPKMFFFQACQGSEYMDAVDQLTADDDETDGPPEYGNDITLPTEADFLYAYSTVPGYYSWRNSTKGSWFIQAIVEVFRKHAHKLDVVRMLTRVNQIVATKKSQTGQRQSHHKRQISSVITQLRKEIYLQPPHGPLKTSKYDY